MGEGCEVKFGIELVPDTRVEKIVHLAKVAEESGFEYVWVTDHYNNRNSYVTLSLISTATSRVKVGVGITNPYVIHPAWTASAIATIDEISGGRAVLGIGAGDLVTLERLGISVEKPLSRVREAVRLIRALHRGESAASEELGVRGAKLGYKTREIPIYIGAQGERMLRLSSEIGDGVLINASNPKDFEFARSVLRRKDGFDVAAYTCFSVDADRKKAEGAARIVVAFIVAGASGDFLRRHGIAEDDVDGVKKAMNAAFREGKWKELAESVTDEMMEEFAIAGTPSECVGKIEDLLDAGVTQLVVGSPIGPSKEDAIKLIGREVIPKVCGGST